MATQTAFILGAGPGLGAALARQFARSGLAVALARRDGAAATALAAEIAALGVPTLGLGVEAGDPAAVEEAVAAAEAQLGPISCAVMNAASLVRAPFLDLTPAQFLTAWEAQAMAGMGFAQAVLRRMAPRGAGFLAFTGATASGKASANFAAFASAKFALRALSMSLAREFGPKGVHVSHVVIDGIIDSARLRATMPAMVERLGEDGLMSPDSIAAAYDYLRGQPKDAWTFELDLRPYKETW